MNDQAHVLPNEVESTPFIRNQGKRLIKRLRKCGVAVGNELEFLTQALRTSAATVSVDFAKGQGKTPEEATAAALEAMGKVKAVEPSDNLGFDLARLLMVNGAAAGRVKAELDKVLFVAGILKEPPAGMFQMEEGPEESFVDHETLDRFPNHNIPRDNY